MGVPPEVITLIFTRRLGYASLNIPDMGWVKRCQSPGARPQKLARRNIAKHALLGQVGLMTQNPSMRIRKPQSPPQGCLVRAFGGAIGPCQGTPAIVLDAQLAANC